MTVAAQVGTIFTCSILGLFYHQVKALKRYMPQLVENAQQVEHCRPAAFCQVFDATVWWWVLQ